MISAFYVQHAGSDLMVVNSARVSFGKRSEMEDDLWGPPKLKEDDARLIRYLAKHNHISPFNHTWVTFQCRAPMFVARQLKNMSICLGMKYLGATQLKILSFMSQRCGGVNLRTRSKGLMVSLTFS